MCLRLVYRPLWRFIISLVARNMPPGETKIVLSVVAALIPSACSPGGACCSILGVPNQPHALPILVFESHLLLFSLFWGAILCGFLWLPFFLLRARALIMTSESPVLLPFSFFGEFLAAVMRGHWGIAWYSIEDYRSPVSAPYLSVFSGQSFQGALLSLFTSLCMVHSAF